MPDPIADIFASPPGKLCAHTKVAETETDWSGNVGAADDSAPQFEGDDTAFVNF